MRGTGVGGETASAKRCSAESMVYRKRAFSNDMEGEVFHGIGAGGPYLKKETGMSLGL